MSTEHAELLYQYLTPDEPFGPIDAREITNPKALDLLFERHNKIYNALHKRPSLVIGRKGSGKTSYLNSVYFDNTYKYVINLDTSDVFNQVIVSINSISVGVVFAESIQKIWRTIIYIGLFSEIREKLPKQYRAKALIDDYLAKIGLREGKTIDDIFWKITDIISEHSKNQPQGIVLDILKTLDNVTFKETLQVLENELIANKSHAVILLDSLDEFHLNTESVGRAIQGLLKFVGESNTPSSHIDIRLCLPAELYHRFMSLSSNPDKDFKRRLLLQWTASELIALAAHRLILFGCSNKDHPLSIDDDLTSVDKHAGDILKQILPDNITCRLGVEEKAIAYILRHTQLLPRHLLIILNAICGDKYKKFFDNKIIKIPEEAIRQGVSSVEETLVQEIFVAFRAIYPNAETACNSCIPELQHKFSIGDLERVFRTHGKKATQSDDFTKFKRMLIEIGAVGRVLDDTGRYIKAEFEYTVPHKLVTSTDDMLCLHPLFTEIFSAKIRDRKPVYPYGSDIEDIDYRDLYR